MFVACWYNSQWKDEKIGWPTGTFRPGKVILELEAHAGHKCLMQAWGMHDAAKCMPGCLLQKPAQHGMHTLYFVCKLRTSRAPIVSLNLPEWVSLPMHCPSETSCSRPTCSKWSACNTLKWLYALLALHWVHVLGYTLTDVGRPAHETFSDIVNSVIVQAKAVWLVRPVYQALYVFADVLVQLF